VLFVDFMLALGGLLGWSVLFARQSATTLESTLLPCCCAAIVILTGAIVLDHAQGARAALIVGGWLGLAVALHQGRGEVLRMLTQPGPIVMGFTVFAMAVVNRDVEFSSWDEFSHWGQIAKLIASTNRYPTKDTFSGLLDYPFGSALFNYLFMPSSRFSETVALQSQAVFVAACFLPWFDGLHWRDWPRVAMITIGAIGIGYLTQSNPWATILSDNLIAVAAAAAVAVYWQNEGRAIGIAVVIPIIAALPLLKDVGAFFAYVALAVIAVDQIRTTRPVWAWMPSLLAALLAVWLVKKGWAQHVETVGVGPTFNLSGDNALSKIATPQFGPYAAEVVTKFLAQLREAAIGTSPIVTVRWLAVIAALTVAGLIPAEKPYVATRVLAFAAILSAGFAIYVTGLFLLYLFSFSSYEGARNASFARYIGTYLLFWLAISVALLCPQGEMRWRWPIPRAVFIILAGIVLASHAPAPCWFACRADGNTHQLRDNIRRAISAGPRNADKVFVVWTGTSGLEARVINYEVTPARSSNYCWSLGSKRFEGDIWECDLSAEEVAKMWRGYDYVFIGHADDAFWTRYGSLFTDDARQSGAFWFRSNGSVLAPVN
jgi:hypothetical protein